MMNYPGYENEPTYFHSPASSATGFRGMTEFTKQLFWFEDEPFGGIPKFYYAKIFKTVRELGTLVLLNGQGIDEALAGYEYYFKRTTRLI
jgi:asparagine synthetase B (glutamine-hydrolysing)